MLSEQVGTFDVFRMFLLSDFAACNLATDTAPGPAGAARPRACSSGPHDPQSQSGVEPNFVSDVNSLIYTLLGLGYFSEGGPVSFAPVPEDPRAAPAAPRATTTHARAQRAGRGKAVKYICVV